ncbi:MAG: response regulator transcription factor [Candidatus Pseudobacter hemicellulosilyticus]|uniref:Response regulator transcription factor n=1 Tax=Candidatus Pseudobacter hemicellulosilyticus TaxID=3121375 RepID=A0AAJ5WTS0_9BACT|nr:MAG: response regulator transcription factor [Pseudobacter sp.]
MHRILIADDHVIVRAGLKQILVEEFPQARIEEVGDTESLLVKIVKEDWDLVISDLSMPGKSGLEALGQIKQQKPKLPVLILSIHPEDQYAVRVLKAGAAGYLNKSLAAEELVIAVNRVLMGRKYITAAVAEKLASQLDDGPQAAHENLSDREFDVLKLIASGKSVSEIAELLSLGVTTVSTYRARVLEKMSMKTNAELTRYALENKLV